MGRRTIGVWGVLLLVAGLACATKTAAAQGVELSRADRQAILYTPQLMFAAGGEPLIKVGLVEGVETITFQASTPFVVLPLGEGGPEVTLPGGQSLTVSVSDSQAGTYRHAVVVAELTPAQRSGLGALRETWTTRGHTVRVAEVGAVFAVAGQRFDTRKSLVLLDAPGGADEARALSDSVQLRWGVDARVHSELDGYPGGLLTLSGLPVGIELRHRDLLMVRGGERTEFTVRDVPYDVGTRGEGRETRRYVGTLIFTVDRHGRLALVNETTVERLLYGIVPAELYASAPAAALQAQAVAARSELLTDLGVRHLADPWMTCADQRCQVYRGLDHEDARTSRAIDATRGQVLADGDQIIKAYFSSNNGGFSGSNASTWNETQRSYLQVRYDAPVIDPQYADGLNSDEEVRRYLSQTPDMFSNITSFASGRNFRWNVELDARALDEAVNARHAVGSVTNLVILERDLSGRVTRLQIDGTRQSVVVERELNIRRTLGGLRSALFSMDIERSGNTLRRVILRGAGFGHGVGLCQSGAIGAAERGLSVEEILANYYPGTTLRRLY